MGDSYRTMTAKEARVAREKLRETEVRDLRDTLTALEAENQRLREALEMVAAQIHSGDDRPDDTWADFTGAQTDQIFSALSRAALEGE